MKIPYVNLFKTLLITVALSMVACEPEFYADEEIFVDEFGEIQIVTFQPDVENGTATFKGEIVSLTSATEEVEYGFMWYAPNTASPNPVKVIIGKTNEVQTFSVPMTTLPRNTTLVVCAYVEENNIGQMIGNEEEFTVGL